METITMNPTVEAMKYAMLRAATQAFLEGRLEFNFAEAGWGPANCAPLLCSDFNRYRILPPHNKTTMNTQDGNPPVTPISYTRELHLQHVQAFWDGNLEWMNPFSDEWAKSINPPNPTELPSRFRIKQPQKLRPWKPDEIPLGAWIRLKEGASSNLIVARNNRIFVICGTQGPEEVGMGFAATNCEHSTNNGKNWLPCGVLE